jgi:hypothetical protein
VNAVAAPAAHEILEQVVEAHVLNIDVEEK